MDPKHLIKFLTSAVERRGSGDEEKEKEKKEDEEEGDGEDKDEIGELQSKTEVHDLLHLAPTEIQIARKVAPIFKTDHSALVFYCILVTYKYFVNIDILELYIFFSLTVTYPFLSLIYHLSIILIIFPKKFDQKTIN